MKPSVFVGFLVSTGVLSTPAMALEYNLGVGNTTLHTSNVARTADDEVNDWVQIPTARLVASHDTGAVELDADYRFERRIYDQDVFDDRNRLTGRADLLWDALPGRIQFFGTNTRTEATINSIQQDVEDNRQLVRTSSVGPRLLLNPRASDQFILEYRYAVVREDDANFFGAGVIDTDSDRNRVTASYRLGISQNRTLSLQAFREEVDFDDPGTPDLDIDNLSLSYQSKSGSVELIASGGYSDITRTQGLSRVDGFVGSLSIDWALSGSRNLIITARRNLNDQSQDLQRGTGRFGRGTVVDNSGLNDVFEEDSVGLVYSSRVGRNTFGFGYRYQTQDFATQNRDEEEHRINARFERRHTPTVSSNISAQFTRREFLFNGVEDDFFSASGNIEWQATRRLAFALGANYTDRDSSNANGFSFEEISGSLSINFDLLSKKIAKQRN